MKLSVDTTELLRAVGSMRNVVERRTSIPILANVRLTAQADGLTLAGTDLDISLVETIGAAVEREGDTTVELQTLYDLLRKCASSGAVAIELSGDKLSVGSGGASFALPTMPAADFPQVVDSTPHASFSMPAGDLRALLGRARFAVSTEETRYYLNGIYLHAAGDCLRAVATDGHRLARIDAPLPAGAAGISAGNGTDGVIVPRKAVDVLSKLLEREDGKRAVAVDVTPFHAANKTGRMVVAMGNAVLRFRLIDGTFPDYQRVIPASNPRRVVAPTRSFSAAVSRVAATASEKSRPVKLIVRQGRCVIVAQSVDTGRAVEEIGAVYDGEDCELGFNANYLREMLAAIDGPAVEISLSDSAAPVIAIDPDDGSALFVQMPMRV